MSSIKESKENMDSNAQSLPENKNVIILGDCLIKLKELEDNSVDSIVTDPPYELGFMGKSWDNTGIANNVDMWKECLRVLKPGGHLLSFGGTRTYHRMACAIEDAGFEVRDMVEWVYGSGMSKCNVWGKGKVRTSKSLNAENDLMVENGWEGWGKGGLKPSHEPICLARKPLSEKTVAENVLKHRTGGINIDESRVEYQSEDDFNSCGWSKMGKEHIGKQQATEGEERWTTGMKFIGDFRDKTKGRFPANLCWSCDCDNNYLTGNALFDILSNISNQIKLCQLNNSNSNALNVEQKKHQQDTTSEEKKLCFAVENVDTLFLEKILGKTLEVIFSVNTECSAEMLEESMNTSLSISLSGNEKMEEYQKVLKFITLTATRLITELKTCNLSQSQIIGSFITKVISGIREQSRVKSHSQDCWVRECFPDTKQPSFRNGDRVSNKNGLVPWNKGRETGREVKGAGFTDTGNASRFFKSIIYQAKASKSERNKGMEELEAKKGGAMMANTGKVMGLGGASIKGEHKEIESVKNSHPTVKPIALMEYLIKMVTKPGGIVLDPFSGSFSTGVACVKNGFGFVGIEREEEYVVIGKARLEQAQKEKEEELKEVSLFQNL